MPHIPVDYAQVNVVMGLTGDSEEMMVTWGIHLNAAESTDNLAIANAFHTNFANRFKPFVCNVYTFKRVDAYFNRGAGNIVVNSTAAAVTATGTGTPLPQNCALLWHKLTGAGGRTGKGRMYLPGVDEGSISSIGALGTGDAATMNTAAGLFLTDIESILGVNSAVLLHSGEADIPNAITALTVDLKVATQRRRLR